MDDKQISCNTVPSLREFDQQYEIKRIILSNVFRHNCLHNSDVLSNMSINDNTSVKITTANILNEMSSSHRSVIHLFDVWQTNTSKAF